MISWAVQKALDHEAEPHPATIAMLCKAESRTTTALMNSRSPSQTKHILEAAFRRASLIYPSSSQQPTKSAEAAHLQHEESLAATAEALVGVSNMIGMQNQMVSAILQKRMEIPGHEHHQAIMDMFNLHQNASVQAVSSSAAALTRLETIVAAWEEAIQNLPQGVRSQHPGQPDDDTATSVYSTPGIGEEQDTQEYIDANDGSMRQDIQQVEQPNETLMHGENAATQTVLIDDDHDDDNTMAVEEASQTENHGDVRPNILDTLAQRSEAA